MAYVTDSRVDSYIDALPEWQQAICREVRDLVHAADPEVAETIKFKDRPYFVLEGNICALLAAKDHVNVFLYDGAIVPDPEHIITGGHDNKTARTVAVRQGERLNAPALLAMFKQIVADNRAGGWRKLKTARPAVDDPYAELKAHFAGADDVTINSGKGSQGMKLGKKMFAMFYKGALVLKLAPERVAELVASGEGVAFDPGTGAPMSDRVLIPIARKDVWISLSEESRRYAGSLP